MVCELMIIRDKSTIAKTLVMNKILTLNNPQSADMP